MLTLVGHGYVGTAIAHELRRRGVTFAWVRHTNSFAPTGPIINAAGYIGVPNVDACEKDRQGCIEGNLLWPMHLERVAGKWPVVHIGSGCVYQGDPGGGWKETDEPNFTGSFYSLTKVLAQRELAPYLARKSYLLRMRMPFSAWDDSKSLLNKFARYPKIIDGMNSISRVEDVAKVAAHFALTLPEPGIYNVANRGAISNRGVVEMMGLTKEWFTEEEFAAFCNAPRSICVLNTDKLQAICPLDDVRVALSKCIPATQPVAAVA